MIMIYTNQWAIVQILSFLFFAFCFAFTTMSAWWDGVIHSFSYVDIGPQYRDVKPKRYFHAHSRTHTHAPRITPRTTVPRTRILHRMHITHHAPHTTHHAPRTTPHATLHTTHHATTHTARSRHHTTTAKHQIKIIV